MGNGLIEERVDNQIYSIDDQRFLPDRYVEGVCPHCGYEKARGDQCDNCSRLLDPTELKEPYSAISGSKNIEVRETRHLYLLQSKMQQRIADWVASKPDWPLLTKSIAGKWIKEGLQDRSITRDLYWGVSVEVDGEAAGPALKRKFSRLVRCADRIYRRDAGMGGCIAARRARLEIVVAS
ncbi:MAG: class I tRNA ligase family protein [Parvularculaceae bacterium]